MASSKEYMNFVLEQLSGLSGIAYRAMMGEYVIYYRGKVVGGIYDNRFLIKPVSAVEKLVPNAQYEIQYEGAGKMILVDVDDRNLMAELVNAAYDELPAPKKRKR